MSEQAPTPEYPKILQALARLTLPVVKSLPPGLLPSTGTNTQLRQWSQHLLGLHKKDQKTLRQIISFIEKSDNTTDKNAVAKLVQRYKEVNPELFAEIPKPTRVIRTDELAVADQAVSVPRPVLRNGSLANVQTAPTQTPQPIFTAPQETYEQEIIDEKFILEELEELRKNKAGTPLILAFQDNDSEFNDQASYIDNSSSRLERFMEIAEDQYYRSDNASALEFNPFAQVEKETLSQWKDRLETIFEKDLASLERNWAIDSDQDRNRSLLKLLCLQLSIEKLTKTISIQNPVLQRPENQQQVSYGLAKDLEKQFGIISGLKKNQGDISSQLEQLIKQTLPQSTNGELSQGELFQPLFEINQNLESLPEIVQKHYQNLTHLLSSYEENLLNLANFCGDQTNFNHRTKDDIQNIFLLQSVFANTSLKLADHYLDYQGVPAKSIATITNIYKYFAKVLEQLYQKSIDAHNQYLENYTSVNRFTRIDEKEKTAQKALPAQTLQTSQPQKLITIVSPLSARLERSISQPFRLPGVVSLKSFYQDNSTATYAVNSLYGNISSPNQDIDKQFRQKLISLKLLSSLPTLSADHSNQSLHGNILESLPRITQIRSTLVKSLYNTCFTPFVEHDLREHLELIYSDLPFKENGVLEHFSPTGIVLNELSDVETNKISSLIIDTNPTEVEQQYQHMLASLESEKIMQIQRNISFMFGALDTQDYADTDLTICITEAIKAALLPKLENNPADLLIIQNPDITTSELMQMVSKYGLNIEDYQTIKDYVAYKGAFIVKHIDDQEKIFFKLIVPRLDQPYLTDIIFACADDILPPDMHIKRDRINGTNYLIVIPPYPKTFGDRTHLPQDDSIDKRSAQSSQPRPNSTKPTFVSTILGDQITIDKILTQQGQTPQNVNTVQTQEQDQQVQKLSEEDENRIDERSNQITVKTSFVLTNEQLQIIRSGDQDAINDLIDQLTAQQGLSRKRAESVKPVPKVEPAIEAPKEFILSVHPVMNNESVDLIISSLLPIINKLTGTLQTQIEHVQCLRKLSSTGNKKLDSKLAEFLKADRLKFYQDIANQSIVFSTNIADILIRGWTCSANERFSDYFMVSDEFVEEIFSPNEALFDVAVTDENRYMYEGIRQGKTRINDYNITDFSHLPQHFIELAVHGLRTTLNKLTDSSDLSDLNFKIEIESEKFIRNIPKTDLKNTFSRNNIIDLVSHFNKYVDYSTAPLEQLEKNQKMIKNPIARAIFDAVVDERRAISELKSLDGTQSRFYTVFSTQSFKSDLLKILLEPSNYQYWSLSNPKNYKKGWDAAKAKVHAKIANNQKIYPPDVNALANSNSIFLLYHALTFEAKDLNWASNSEHIKNVIYDVDLVHQLGENYQEEPIKQVEKKGMRKKGVNEINLNEIQDSDDRPVDRHTLNSLKGQIETVLQSTQVYQNDVEMVSDLVYSLKNSTNPKISYPSDSFAAGVWNIRNSKIRTNSGDISDYISFEKGFLKGVKDVVLSKKFLEKSFGKVNLPLEINLAQEKCEETLGIMLGSTIMQGTKLPDGNQNKTIFDQAFIDFISIPIPHLYFAFLTDVDIEDFDNFKAWLNTLK